MITTFGMVVMLATTGVMVWNKVSLPQLGVMLLMMLATHGLIRLLEKERSVSSAFTLLEVVVPKEVNVNISTEFQLPQIWQRLICHMTVLVENGSEATARIWVELVLSMMIVVLSMWLASNVSMDMISKKLSLVISQIELVNVIFRLSIAFVRYRMRCGAEFAKVAMAGQALDREEVLNIRWAFADPNPIAKESIVRSNRDALIIGLRARGIQ